MSPGSPRLDDLPVDFPIFPLAGALLLPHCRLPLNIFEPRYLAMTEDALANGRHIAMIQPDSAAHTSHNGPALHRVGCLGRISAFSEAEGGRYLITLSGLLRFTIAEELQMQRGYRRVRADFREFMHDLGEPAQDPPEAIDRPALMDALRGYFAGRGIEANLSALAAMTDPGLVSTIAMACPFDPLEKQALLEAPAFADQARALLTLLRIDMHGPSADDGGRPS